MGCGGQRSVGVRATHCRERAKGDGQRVAGDEVLPQRGCEGSRREGEGEVHLGRRRWGLMRKQMGVKRVEKEKGVEVNRERAWRVRVMLMRKVLCTPACTPRL